MNYTILVPPLIGAAIGYVTNWIAVKMLFRPLKPIKIGKLTLPFTPGMIPRNKERLASSIANAISNHLLTETDLKDTLLSEDMKNQMKEAIKHFLETNPYIDVRVEDFLEQKMGREQYDMLSKTIVTNLSHNLLDTVKQAHFGNIISEQIAKVAQEKLKGSLIGLFGGTAMVSSMTGQVAAQIDTYIEENGLTLLQEMVEKQIKNYTQKTVGAFTEKIDASIHLQDMVLQLYESFIVEKLPMILKFLNITKIIEDKINQMDMLELEKLILAVMKKELNAVVNLGALIGFILGLLNLCI